MKKTLFIVVLTSALILSACSTSTSPTTSETASTTEATTTTEVTTTTTEVTTTTSAAPVLEDKPETYADVDFNNFDDESKTAFASDFEFVDATLSKDENNVYAYPNYSVDKDIVVKFKCDKQFKYGSIYQYDSSMQYDDTFRINIYRYTLTGNIAKTSHGKKGFTSDISKFLSNKDGVYSLTIPSQYAKANKQFYVLLFTECKLKNKDYGEKMNALEAFNLNMGYAMVFRVRCGETTLPIKPTFTPEDHAGVGNDVNATNFNFGNAKLSVSNDGHRYYAEWPKYPAGQDIVVTFNCSNELALESIFIRNTSDDNDEGKYYTDSDHVTITCVNETYTVTVPAKYVQSGNTYLLNLMSKDGKSLFIFFNS